jgi:hypothetical protein
MATTSPLGNDDDGDEYGEDGNIPSDEDEYALRASYSQHRPLRV